MPAESSKPTCYSATGGVILALGCLLAGVPQGSAQNVPAVPLSQRIMRLTQAQMEENMRQMWAARQFSVAGTGSGKQSKALPTSVDLYPLLSNVPSQRNQGHCGNCWAWGCTGTMEIALNVQNGIRDRLSVQFINSCNPYRSCCAAGGFATFRDFYQYEWFAIPWSNPGASWSSTDGSCIPCGDITTTPRYPIGSIDFYTITTKGVGQAAAITNIKTALSQNKGLYFYFNVPNQADWDAFEGFFFNQTENDIWSNAFCNDTYDSNSGGHVVLCVGYVDQGADRYWVMLNSWGAWGTGSSAGRPTGKYRVSMDIDYNCTPGLGFQAIDISFCLPPLITAQPQSLMVTQGNTATFSIDVADGTPVTYQWRKNGANIGGATTSALTLLNVSTNQTGTYDVALSYCAGSTNSVPATLTVSVPPTILAQPQSRGAPRETPVTFTVTAIGVPEVYYQWHWSNGVSSVTYPQGTNNSSRTGYMEGSYWCVLSNMAGQATSQVAKLTYYDPPVITVQPQSVSVLHDTPALFSLVATGTPSLYYQWHWSNAVVSLTYPQGTNNTTRWAYVPGAYWCVVSNAGGAVASDVAWLTWFYEPVFESIRRRADGAMELTMSGTAGSNYTLQWGSNMQSWPNSCTIFAPSDEFYYTDCSATNASQRFYRLLLGP